MNGPGGAGGEDRLLVLAADHRARGVATIERYADYLAALRSALVHCDGILSTVQPLGDLAAGDALAPGQRTYLSLNRTGMAGTAFELDDRLVASVDRARRDGWTGVKVMARIAPDDPGGAGAIELLGRVLEEAASAGLEALVEPVVWRRGRISRQVDDIVLAAVVAHDLGAPLLKVPVPDEAPGAARVSAVNRVVGSVGVRVLFLGGPRRSDAEPIEDVAVDVIEGGGRGSGRGPCGDRGPGSGRYGRPAGGDRPRPMILTLDLGTSTTKAALWEPGGAVGVAEVTLTTRRPEPGAQEQDPADWWRSVVAACGALATRVPGGLAAVEAVSLTGARQTFGPFDAAGVPTGPGLLWSDGRPARRRPGGRHPAPDRPGVPGEAAYLPARLAWMSVHHPDRLERAAWILAPHGRRRLAADRVGVHRPDLRLADRLLRGRRDGRRRPARPVGGVAAARRALRPGHGDDRAGGRHRTGSAHRHPGGDRRR